LTRREDPFRRRAGVAVAVAAMAALAAALAAGCPLPQPLAEVARVDGGTVSPPRIVAESAVPSDTIVLVSRSCATAVFSLAAEVEDVNTTESVEARWFVDYSPDVVQIPLAQVVPADADSSNPIRNVPPYSFDALKAGTTAPLHVVELIVSNAFQPISTTSPAENRSAQPGYETDVYRWVFQYVDTGGRCQ
jgi:hypothetical protein